MQPCLASVCDIGCRHCQLQDTFEVAMGTSIGDARASIRSQSTDRLTEDPLVTGLQRDGLYVDPGSRALEHSDRSSPLPRPLHTGDAVLIAIFGRLRTSA